MRTFRGGLLLLLVLAASGCLNAVRVYRRPLSEAVICADPTGSKGCKTDGIPFLRKKAVYRQTTSYEARRLLVTLEIGPRDDKGFVPITTSKRLVAVDSKELNAFKDYLAPKTLETVASDAENVERAKDVLQKFLTLKDLAPGDWAAPAGVPTVLVANSVDIVTVLDTANEYYLNGKFPWFGNSTVSGELGSDGTLSKGSVQAESKVADALSALLPVKDFFASKLIPQAPAAAATPAAAMLHIENVTGERGKPTSTAAAPEKTKPWTYALTVESVGYVYTFTKDSDSPTPPKAALPFDLSQPYTRSEIGAAPKGDDGAKKVSFSGSVKLPS